MQAATEQTGAAPPATDRLDERELLARFAAGDESAFDAIVAAHEAAVARLARRLLGWPQDVGDVVQEVFIAAYAGLARFRGESSLGTWLTRITINKCRRQLRRRALRQVFQMADARDRRLVHCGSTPDRELMNGERHARVRRAVYGLPDKYREVIVLRYLEDQSVREIAASLAISPGAVEVRLTRARARLRQRLTAFIMED